MLMISQVQGPLAQPGDVRVNQDGNGQIDNRDNVTTDLIGFGSITNAHKCELFADIYIVEGATAD
jgi:hypothetical protein